MYLGRRTSEGGRLPSREAFQIPYRARRPRLEPGRRRQRVLNRGESISGSAELRGAHVDQPEVPA